MTALEWVIVITAVAGVGGTGMGGFIGALFKSDSEKSVSFLLSFAAGVMLSVVCFDLLAEAVTLRSGLMHVFLTAGMVMLGYGVIFLLNYIIDKNTNHEISHIDDDHPKTADQLSELIHSDHYEEHKKKNTMSSLFIGGLVMACAIALHNMPEGMVIGTSYANEMSKSFSTFSSGMILAVVIGLHNIPEGMSVSVPLIAGGMTKPKAVLLTAVTGAPTIIGAIIGYSLGSLGPLSLSLSLSFASGAMLYVVFGELLPEAILMWRSKIPALGMLIGLLAGMIMIYA